MSDKETRNFHDLIKEKMEKDGPAIYRHLGYEQDHLRKIIAIQKQDETETIEFSHSLYLPVIDETGEIIRYDIQDTQEWLGELKTRHNNTHADRLRNMTFKNVFFFSDYPDVFKEAKKNKLPFVIITTVMN